MFRKIILSFSVVSAAFLPFCLHADNAGLELDPFSGTLSLTSEDGPGTLSTEIFVVGPVPGQDTPNTPDGDPDGGNPPPPTCDGIDVCLSNCDWLFDAYGAPYCNPATYLCQPKPGCEIGYGCACVFIYEGSSSSSSFSSSSETSSSTESSVSSPSSSSASSETSEGSSSSQSSEVSSSEESSSVVSSASSSVISSEGSSSSSDSSESSSQSSAASSWSEESSASSETSESSSSAISSSSENSSEASSESSSSESSTDSSAPPASNCAEEVLVDAKQSLAIGPGLLAEYAQSVLKKLRKNLAKTSTRALKADAVRMQKKADKLIELAKGLLAQLPDVNVVCSNEPHCFATDNTEVINKHIAAIVKLRNQITRGLNRATRIVYLNPVEARKRTARFGKRVRRDGKNLLETAMGLPKIHYECF